MVSCFVTDCTHHSSTAGCRFQRFPKEAGLRKRWCELIRRADAEPNDHTRVCSSHFRNGNFDKLPTLFQRNQFGFQFASPEKFKRRPRKRKLFPDTEEVTCAQPTEIIEICDTEEVECLTLTDALEIADAEEVTGTSPLPIDSIEIVETEEMTYPMQTDDVEILDGLKPMKQTQTEYEFSPVVYEAQIDQLQREMEALKIEMQLLRKHPFGFFSLRGDNALCFYYTGLHIDVFSLLEEICATVCHQLPSYDGKKVAILNFKDQFLLIFMKLRLNLDFIDLSERFGISRTTTYRIFCTLLPALHVTVFQSCVQELPTRTRIQRSLPACFTSFRNCRMVIDCTEFRCESPSNMGEQKLIYSSYKHHPSVKVAIGILPNGTAVACSPCYPGSISDKAIVSHSGILKPLVPGDMILADKGFLISDLLPAGVYLNIPPFLTRKQFTPSEVSRTRSIAQARIHIERFNIRLKRYRILQLIPYTTFNYVTMVVQTCVGLVNMKDPLLKEISL